MLLLKCLPGTRDTCTLRSLPRRVFAWPFWRPNVLALLTPISVPWRELPHLLSPQSLCCKPRPKAMWRWPASHMLWHGSRKEKRPLLLTPLSGQVCTVAELCAQPPQELGTPSPLGHGVTTAAASAALEGRGLLALSAPGQSLSLAQTQRQWEAMGTLGPAGLSPWDGRSVGHGAAGVAVTAKGTVSHWLVRRLLLPRLTKDS